MFLHSSQWYAHETKQREKKTHRKSHIDRPIDFGQSLSSSEQLQQEFFSYKGENKNRRKKSTTASRNKRKRNKLWLCKGSHITIKMISYMLLKIIMFNILIHNGNGKWQWHWEQQQHQHQRNEINDVYRNQ